MGIKHKPQEQLIIPIVFRLGIAIMVGTKVSCLISVKSVSKNVTWITLFCKKRLSIGNENYADKSVTCQH